VRSLIPSHDRFFLASNNEANSQRDQREVLRLLQSSPEQADKIAHYFYEKTRKLIVAKSFKLSDTNTRYVDIVRDVLRYVPLYWAATELVCDFKVIQFDVTNDLLYLTNRLA
jgi:linoleate 10R-lipoxygenase